MTVIQPFYIRVEDAPSLPQGWSYLTTEEATVKLKPGKLFDKKTTKASGQVPVLSQGQTDYVGFHDEDAGVDASANRPVVTFANHTCAMRYMTSPFSCIQNIFPKVGKAGVADTRFFFYAAQGRVNLTDYKGHHPLFRQALIPIPPLETQQRIVEILGAYDDLIEVNRRRVEVLEEMARGLFEEWFVRFRFPGHEDVPIVETPDGPLPEGWEWAPLKTLVALRSGFAFKSSTFRNDAQYSIVTIKHVHDGLLKPPFTSRVDEIPNKMPTHCKIVEGDILVSLTGNVGRTCLAWGEDLLLNQRVAKVDPLEEHYRAFAYCWFRSPHTLKRLQNIANGAAQQNLSPVQTVGLTIASPPAWLASRFEGLGHPILQSIVLAHRSTAALQGQRDLLLPRLISGQLSVETAERELEDAA